MRLTTVWWLVRGAPRQFMVMWANSRCSILFHLLVPGGGCEGGELTFPGPQSGAVEAAAIGGDQQSVGIGVGAAAFVVPPVAQRRHGERRGVVVGAHRHPSGVRADVIHAVWDGLAQGRVEEVMDVDRYRGAGWPVVTPGVLELSDELAG